MCGIAGLLRFDGGPVDTTLLATMTDSLAHRGPDGRGVWIDGPVGLGHRRLAIRGLTPTAAQPMVSGDIVVTYNGEIYNDGELRPRLSNTVPTNFRGDCDTEIIAPGWLAWGEELFAQMRGMFAIALWDARQRRLILARDHLGVKPIYFARTERHLAFASEVKALMPVPGQSRDLDPINLHRMLAQGYAGPAHSIVEGIEQLPPGHFAVIEADGRTRVSSYWRPRRSGSIRDFATAREEFIPLWRRSVGDMLVSDRPLGVLLSGGVDSSLIATELAGRPDVPAFTAQFAEADHDETRLAAMTAGAAQLPHRVVPVDTGRDTEATFRAVVRAFDGQIADSSAFALYLVCREAGKTVPVLMSGEGGDELFGGYPTYRASRLAARIGSLLPRASSLARVLEAMCAGNEGRPSSVDKLARFLRGAGQGSSAHPEWRRYLHADGVSSLYGKGMLAATEHIDPLGEYAAALNIDPGAPLVDRALLADQSHYLPGDMLLKADAMSMAHGIEIRVPLLDLRVVEFAARLNTDLLCPWRGPDKKFLRRILAERPVGREIASGGKRGFQVPVARLLRQGLRDLGDRLLDRDADILAPLLSADGIRRLWRAHQDRRANHGYVLWTLLTVATWRDSTASTMAQ